MDVAFVENPITRLSIFRLSSRNLKVKTPAVSSRLVNHRRTKLISILDKVVYNSPTPVDRPSVAVFSWFTNTHPHSRQPHLSIQLRLNRKRTHQRCSRHTRRSFLAKKYCCAQRWSYSMTVAELRSLRGFSWTAARSST